MVVVIVATDGSSLPGGLNSQHSNRSWMASLVHDMNIEVGLLSSMTWSCISSWKGRKAVA